MKTYITLAILSIFILAGCSSTKSTAEYDDVYYSTREKKKKNKKNKEIETQTASPDYYISSDDATTDYYIEDYEAGEYVQYQDEPDASSYDSSTSPEGVTYITNNYYDGYGGYGDYYDYSYASRISRFHSSYMGFNYYAPCYSGFYYDPWYWDYYWYRPSFYFGFNWGWGYPYYYYPYNNYWYGYNTGYWDGYYASNYYGYSSNGYYYGPRTSRSSTNSPYTGSNSYFPENSTTYSRSNYLERTTPVLADISSVNRASIKTVTGPDRTSSQIVNPNPNNKRGVSSINTSVKTIQTDKNRLENQPNAANRNAVKTGLTGGSILVDNKPQNDVTKSPQKKTATKSRYTYKKPVTETKTKFQPGQSIGNQKQAKPTQKYTKPSNVTTQDRSRSNSQKSTSGRNTQTYTKPTSTYNKSYTKPTRYNSNSNNRANQPTRSSNSYSTPSRTNTKSYSQPSKTTRTYSSPSRSGSSKSYSSPSRSSSSKSYSSPSRSSSRSYSSPSRSSSGGGSRSSSKSSGGRR